MDPYKRLFMSGDITMTFTWKITAQTRGFSHGFPQKAESWAHISSLWLREAGPWQSSCSLMVIPEKHLPRQGQSEHISWISHTRKCRGWRGTTVTSSWCPQYLLPWASALWPELCLLGRDITQQTFMQLCSWRKQQSRTKTNQSLFATFSSQRAAKHKSQHQACLKVVVWANPDHQHGAYFASTKSKQQEAWLYFLNLNFLRNKQPYTLRPGTSQ